jgi:hypothetical protein
MALASLLSSPLFLSFLPCLSFVVPVIDLDPECRLNNRKIGVLLEISNSVSAGFGWGLMFIARGFEGGGQGRHKFNLETGNIHNVEYKTCTCYEDFSCNFRFQRT